MPCGGTGEQRANRSNGLAIAPDNAAHVALPQLKSKDNHAPVGNFRNHHFLGEFDQLSNDEFKKLSHEASLAIHQASVQSQHCSREPRSRWEGEPLRENSAAQPSSPTPATAYSAVASAGAEAARALFFFSKLRTVSDGRAPRAIQCSARSTLIILLSPGFFGSYVPRSSMNFPSRGLRLSATITL